MKSLSHFFYSSLALFFLILVGTSACFSPSNINFTGKLVNLTASGATINDVVTVSPVQLGTFYLASSTNIPLASWFTIFQSFPSSLTLLDQYQAQHIRMQSGLSPQITANSWDFSAFDSLVQPVLTLGDHSPELQLGSAPSFMYSSPSVFSDPTFGQFAAYAANMVKYYNTGGFTANDGSHVSPSSTPLKWWGIFNEPEYQSITPTQYVSMYNTLVPAMKAADPSIKTVALEVGGDVGALTTYGSAFINGVTAPVDAVGIHLYAGCDTTVSDATLMSSSGAFGPAVANLNWLLQGNPITAHSQVWVTENNIEGCGNTNDPRGSDGFFTAWKPYVFSQIGKAGAHVVQEWYFGGAPQYGELYLLSGAIGISYWVDYWLAHYFPATASSQRLQIDESDSEEIETLAVENPDGSVIIMVNNHAIANPSDVDGAGAPRTVSLNLNGLGSFSSATRLTIDHSTNAATGPSEVPIAVSSQMQITFAGYGVTFIHLLKSGSGQTTTGELDKSWGPEWSSLVGLWHMNGIPGSIANNAVVLDGSSMASEALTSDGSSSYAAGRLNQGINFTGAGSVVLPATVAPNPCTAMTVGFWMNSALKANGVGLMQKDDYTSLGWVLSSTASGSLFLRIDTSGGVNQIAAWNGNDNFFDGKWHYVSFTLSAGNVVLYKDGVQDSTASFAPGAGFCNASQPLYIGVNLTGTLDEAAIWSKALTSAEIQTIYSRQSQ